LSQGKMLFISTREWRWPTQRRKTGVNVIYLFSSSLPTFRTNRQVFVA